MRIAGNLRIVIAAWTLVVAVACAACSGPSGSANADGFGGAPVADSGALPDAPPPLGDSAASDDAMATADARSEGDGWRAGAAEAGGSADAGTAADGGAGADAAVADAAPPAASWAPLGGNGLTVARPAAVARGSRLYLYVTGTNGEVWQNIRVSGAVWSGWAKLPGSDLPQASDPPAAAISAGGTITLLVRAKSGAIYAKRRLSTSWAQAVRVGTLLASAAPAAFYDTDKKLHVLAPTSDGRLHDASRSGTTWSGFSAVPLAAASTIAGAPSAALDKSSILRIFVRDTQGKLWRARRVSKTWLPWQLLDQVARTPSPPTVVKDAQGLMRLFVRGLDDAVYANRRAGGAWQGWVKVGGATYGGVGVVRDGSYLRLFTRGASDRIETAYPL